MQDADLAALDDEDQQQVTALVPFVTQPRKLRRTTKAKPRGRQGNDDAELFPSDGEEDESEVCFMCGEPGDLSHSFLSKKMHHVCFLGVRCHRRLLKTSEAREADDALFHNEPEEWKNEVMPLVTPEGGKRSRAAVSQHAANMKGFTEDFEQDGHVYLSKRRFKSYTSFWDGYGSETASESFEDRLAAASSDHENDKGEPQVRVQDNSKVVRKKGVKSSTKVPRSAARESGQRNRSRGSSGGRRRRSRSRKPRVPRGKQDVVPIPDLAQARGSRRGAGRAESGPRKSEGSTASRSKNTSSRRPSPTEESAKPANPAVDFMRKKAAVMAQIEQVLNSNALKSSYPNRLKKAMGKLDTSELQELKKTGNADAALQDFELQASRLKKLQDEARDCDKDTIDDIENRSKQTIKVLEEKTHDLDQLQEAAAFLIDQATGARRKASMALRYATNKISQKLAVGGFGPAFAKVCAAGLQAAEDSSEKIAAEIDFEKIMLIDTEIEGKSVARAVKEYQAACTAQVLDKLKSVCEFLKNNDKKTGALIRIDHGSSVPEPASFMGANDDTSLAHHPGAGPWICGVKANSFRSGPSAWPLPGIGSYVQSFSPAETIKVASDYLLLLPLQPLVDAGVVVLNDLAKFLETETGQQIPKNEMKIVKLEGSKIAWVPYGWWVVPLTFSPDGKECLGCFWVLPFFSKEFALKGDEKVKTPLHKLNKEHLEKLKGQEIWGKRLECFQEFESKLQ